MIKFDLVIIKIKY